METAIDKATAKGTAKGMAEGMAKGMAEGIAKGMTKGIAKGIAKGKADAMTIVVRNMLEKNKSIKEIVELTGLTDTQIKALKKCRGNKRAKS